MNCLNSASILARTPGRRAAGISLTGADDEPSSDNGKSRLIRRMASASSIRDMRANAPSPIIMSLYILFAIFTGPGVSSRSNAAFIRLDSSSCEYVFLREWNPCDNAVKLQN